uniref:Uncharacterized protein n=1 Tax=Romanomermis culicivorax TaxID=13658 RepID=A0A915L339_ROMCU
MFRSFLKFWQDVSVKTWDEFLKSPDSVRICMNKIVGTRSKNRIDSCLKNNGFEGVPDSYTEDFEVPYCMLQTAGSGDLQAMKAGIQEKAAVIHELHECKKKDGANTSKRTIFCIDAFRTNFTRINFCPISDACKRQKVSDACSDHVRNIVASTCACTRAYRDSILNKIDVMYRSGSLNILKLAPAFLGLDLTKSSSDQLKKCYARASVLPPGFLTTDTSPLLDILTGFQPRPEGVQNLKNLIYAQFDLPDLCENVCQF